MPLSNYVTHDKSKMISLGTGDLGYSILHPKGAFNYIWVIQLPRCCSLLQITVDEEIARLYIVKELVAAGLPLVLTYI